MIEETLEEIYENPGNFTGSLLLIEKRNKFRPEFVRRVHEVVGHVLEEYEHGPVMELAVKWLDCIFQSRIRNVRSCAAELMGILVERQTQLYEAYMDQKNTKKAYARTANITLYFERIIKGRLSAIDYAIRGKASGLLSDMVLAVPDQFISQKYLSSHCTPLLEEQNEAVTEALLSALLLMLGLALDKGRYRKELVGYSRTILKLLD